MSPIGRVFIVINLILAGAFVAMAGTFLQRHTDYKAKHDQKVAELAQAESDADAAKSEADGRIQDQDRELHRTSATLQTARADASSLTDENERLKAQLADLASDVKSLNSRAATTADAVDRSTADSKQAMQMAMKATEEREAARNEKEAAEASLSEARSQIASLEDKLAGQMDMVASLEQTVAENNVLIGYVNSNYPGAIALAQPDLRGVVEQASGDICTVRITENPAAADIKAGFRLALYKGRTYKGEALIRQVDGELAFCKVNRLVDNMTISAGDAAATNVGF